MPAASSAARIAAKLLPCGSLAPRSKSTTVALDTLAAFASSSWLQLSIPRAPRHCAGQIDLFVKYMTF